jgi:Carboxypeptidase regulatory-like domain
MRIACALLVASLALAQTPAEIKPAAVSGKVVNSLNGEIIRKAELTLSTDMMPDDYGPMAAQLGLDVPKEKKKSFAATSDASGKFRFEKVDPGDYFFVVKHAGFVDLFYKGAGAKAEEGMLHLKAGQEVVELELRMIPQGTAAGKVVDEDGDPVTNAMVTAEAVTYASGHRELQLRDSGSTNDRGEFRLGKLPPGRYYISADVLQMDFMAQAPAPPKDGLPETGYVTTYFPKTTDSALAEAVDIKPGDEVPGVNIQMQKSRVVRVKGKALGADGKPLTGAQIMLMNPSRPGSMRMIMLNSADGSFEMAHVVPGTYTAMIMQMADHKMMQQPLMVPTENLSDVKLGVLAEGTVQGRVNVTGDGKIAVKGLPVSLNASGEAIVMPSNAVADESGAFAMKKVVAARYEFRLSRLPAGSYLKSVLWNGKEKLGEPIDFSAEGSADLQVYLGTDGGAFDAKVARDDKPSEDATVVLLPADPARRNPHTTRSESTDAAGHVAFKDVAPGDYLAIAWEKIEEGDWFDPAVIKAAGSNAAKVTIGSKDNQHAELKVLSAPK